ncbi:hypothetical protein [Streptomyces sp. NPDC001970]
MGAYLTWYWYPAATGGTGTASSAGGLARFSAAVSTWVQAHTTLLAALTVIAAVAVTALTLGHRPRSRTTRQPTAEAQHDDIPRPGESGSHCC